MASLAELKKVVFEPLLLRVLTAYIDVPLTPISMCPFAPVLDAKLTKACCLRHVSKISGVIFSKWSSALFLSFFLFFLSFLISFSLFF